MHLPAAQTKKTRIYEDEDAVSRLKELKLSIEGLTEVVRRGENARAEATLNDPVNAAGIDAYRYRVRALRDIFAKGWVRRTLDGLELLQRKDEQIAIVTRGGKDGVGIPGTWPQPNRSVGDSTKQAISPQLVLEGVLDRPVRASASGPLIYMLLVESSLTRVRSELSLPTGVGEDGQVSGWIERVLLPTIDLDSPDPMRKEPDAPIATIEVPVFRRR